MYLPAEYVVWGREATNRMFKVSGLLGSSLLGAGVGALANTALASQNPYSDLQAEAIKGALLGGGLGAGGHALNRLGSMAVLPLSLGAGWGALQYFNAQNPPAPPATYDWRTATTR